MPVNLVFSEKLSSKKTESIFIGLAVLFMVPFTVFASIRPFGGWSILFCCLSVFFLFYSLNYRTLVIQIDEHSLRLKEKQGLVRDIAFSTQHPEDVIRLVGDPWNS